MRFILYKILGYVGLANYNFIVYYDIIQVGYNHYEGIERSTEFKINEISWKHFFNVLPLSAVEQMSSNKAKE